MRIATTATVIRPGAGAYRDRESRRRLQAERHGSVRREPGNGSTARDSEGRGLVMSSLSTSEEDEGCRNGTERRALQATDRWSFANASSLLQSGYVGSRRVGQPFRPTPSPSMAPSNHPVNHSTERFPGGSADLATPTRNVRNSSTGLEDVLPAPVGTRKSLERGRCEITPGSRTIPPSPPHRQPGRPAHRSSCLLRAPGSFPPPPGPRLLSIYLFQ